MKFVSHCSYGCNLWIVDKADNVCDTSLELNYIIQAIDNEQVEGTSPKEQKIIFHCIYRCLWYVVGATDNGGVDKYCWRNRISYFIVSTDAYGTLLDPQTMVGSIVHRRRNNRSYFIAAADDAYDILLEPHTMVGLSLHHRRDRRSYFIAAWWGLEGS